MRRDARRALLHVGVLRSVTQGVGTYRTEFDHLQELTGKQADQVVAARKAAE